MCNQPRQSFGTIRSAISFLLLIILYFGAIAILIALTLIFKIPLITRDFIFGYFPSNLALLIGFVYRIGPFVFAGFYGFLYRPLYLSAVLLSLSIFAIHGIYSTIVAIPIHREIDRIKQESKMSESALFTTSSFSHKFIDKKGDGLIDIVKISGNLKGEHLVIGQYSIHFYFVQGSKEFSFGSGGDFNIDSDRREIEYPISLEFDPNSIKDILEFGQISVKLEIMRRGYTVNSDPKDINFCTWALFSCPSYVESYLGGAYGFKRELKNIYTFPFDVNKVQRDQIIFLQYLKDYGRDTDGDGRFNELVIPMKVDSIYEGPLYFSGKIDKWTNKFVKSTTKIQKGISTIEFVIKGEDLKKININGSYSFLDFYFLNNDPNCPGGNCKIEHTPIITVYLEPYRTQSYQVSQFN